jgi:hypothetical protein
MRPRKRAKLHAFFSKSFFRKGYTGIASKGIVKPEAIALVLLR